MDFRTLLKELDTIAEAGRNAGDPYDSGMYADDDAPTAAGQNPAYDNYVAQMKAKGMNANYDDFLRQPESDAYKDATKNVPKAPPATQSPATSQSNNDQDTADQDKYKPNLNTNQNLNNVTRSPTQHAQYPDYDETPASQPQQTAQPSGDKNVLLKQLYDVTTDLFNLTTQAIQSKSYESIGKIEYALLESFGMVFEGPIGDQRTQLSSKANQIIQSLQQFKDDPTVASAIAKAQEAMKAPASPGPMYKLDNEKVKRFQELMAKATAAPKPAAQKPAAPAQTPAAGKQAPQQPTKPVAQTPGTKPEPTKSSSAMAAPAKLSLDSTPDKIEAAFNALPTDKKVKLQKFLQDQDQGAISSVLSKFGFGGMDMGASGELDQPTKALLSKYKHDAIRYLQNPT